MTNFGFIFSYTCRTQSLARHSYHANSHEKDQVHCSIAFGCSIFYGRLHIDDEVAKDAEEFAGAKDLFDEQLQKHGVVSVIDGIENLPRFVVERIAQIRRVVRNEELVVLVFDLAGADPCGSCCGSSAGQSKLAFLR